MQEHHLFCLLLWKKGLLLSHSEIEAKAPRSVHISLGADNNSQCFLQFTHKDKRLVSVKMVLQMYTRCDEQTCVCVYMDKNLIVYLTQK